MFRVSLLVFESLPSYHPKGEGCSYIPTLFEIAFRADTKTCLVKYEQQVP